jgi:protein-L-isoaspartate O-methyltransferase
LLGTRRKQTGQEPHREQTRGTASGRGRPQEAPGSFLGAPTKCLGRDERVPPIGFGKTISQPFIVALMTDLLEMNAADAVLEIGTGLGYQAAILSEIANWVYTMEIIEELAQEAGKRLDGLEYRHIDCRTGDGSRGWLEYAPYDKIIVAAAPETIPLTLVGQPKPGGKMVIPVGRGGTAPVPGSQGPRRPNPDQGRALGELRPTHPQSLALAIESDIGSGLSCP